MKAHISIALGLHANEVSVFVQADLVQKGLGEELVCFVEGLFEKPERTTSVRQQVAESALMALTSLAKDCLPQCFKAEVVVGRFNQKTDGFAVAEGSDLHVKTWV